MIVRFFKEVELHKTVTTINYDGSIDIVESTVIPRIGQMFKIEEIIETDDKRFINIVLPSDESESKIFHNVDTLTCSILGGVPNSIVDNSKPNTGGCCS